MVNASMTTKGDLVLLAVEKVTVVGPGGKEFEALQFNDTGSTLSFCENYWAHGKGFPSEPITLYLKVLGGEYEEIHTREYTFSIRGVDGKPRVIKAAGLDKLTQECPHDSPPDLSEVYHLFPDIPPADIERPQGPVQILLGADYAGYLPTVLAAS